MIPVPPDLDLQRTLDNDGARETLYAKGGPFVELLARLGAFAHHPAEQTDYHDQKGSGYPRANMRKDRIPLDPTLLALVGDGNVNAREALMVAILLAVGCSKAPAPASGGTGTTASNASTAAVASTAKPVSPRVSPCATDADCSVLLEPCRVGRDVRGRAPTKLRRGKPLHARQGDLRSFDEDLSRRAVAPPFATRVAAAARPFGPP